MKSTKSLLLSIAFICVALLAGALYFQIVEEMAPCPWCVIQRYIFVAIAIVCLVFAFLPNTLHRTGITLAALLSAGGAGAAGWLLWVQAHPGVSCGIDPMETSLNTLLPAQWFPTLFQADGLCTTVYDNILGLSISQWACVAFVALTITLGYAAFKRR
jgi:disulfide bond formation protein DsbB